MEGYGWNSFHNVFKLFCIVATVILVIWCCYEFSKDEDVCEVIFKRWLVDDDSVYPTMSLVISDLFNETALKEYDQNYTRMDYRNHFMVNPNPKMFDIDHDLVGMKAEDYVLKTCLHKTFHDALASKMSGECTPYTKIKTTSYFHTKVITFQLPEKQSLYALAIKLKKSIFEGSIRPVSSVNPYLFLYICFHLENKVYSSLSSCLDTWPTRNEKSSKYYSMRFIVKSMETLRRRKKRSKKCYDDPDYDYMMREHIIDSTGCRPNFWSSNTTKPKCSTKEEYQSILSQHFDHSTRFNTSKEYLDPCLGIERLQVDYQENDLDKFPFSKEEKKDEDDWFMIEYQIQATTFKEIKQTRAYSVQSLIGNLGGYIGLCLGYAILNLPSMVVDIWITLKKFGKKDRHEGSSHVDKWGLKTV